MNNQVLVTVCCLAYNHEKFIRQCLDGFVMQKTNFKFEVIIHDDASTDKTAEIIKEYQEKYPDLFKPIYQTENQFSQGKSVTKYFLFPPAKSKYFAFCEGDDYWTDPNKLQKQVDFLESNPEYSLCFHPVKVIYEDNPNKHRVFPNPKSNLRKFTFENLLKSNFIQTNSIMYRWQFVEKDIKNFLPDGMMPTDWYWHLIHAKVGKIGFIKDVMSVYRKHSDGVWYSTDAVATNLHLKYGINEINFYNNVYENLADKSEKYLNETYMPVFKQIIDVYYSFGDVDKLSEIKSLYPKIFEKAMQVQNPMGIRLKKYKKYYTYLLVISIILFLLNILQLIF